jgi:hypothetical protein
MPSQLHLPRSHIAALSKLSAADEPAFRKFAGGLQHLGPTADRQALLDYLEPFANELGNGLVLNDLVTALISAQVTRFHYEWSTERTASEVFDAGLADGFEGLNRTDFEKRVAALLNLPAFSRTAKAIDLLTESAHLYHDARVLTDLRPIFGADVTKPPEGVLIVHRLRIEFHDTEGIRTMFFTLDPKDIEQLGKVVRRAEKKEISLRSMLTKFDLPILDTGGDE